MIDCVNVFKILAKITMSLKNEMLCLIALLHFEFLSRSNKHHKAFRPAELYGLKRQKKSEKCVFSPAGLQSSAFIDVHLIIRSIRFGI